MRQNHTVHSASVRRRSPAAKIDDGCPCSGCPCSDGSAGASTLAESIAAAGRSAESAALAERLLAETITKQGADRGQLTIHADNGSSMASKPVAFLLADLVVTKSHSRPNV